MLEDEKSEEAGSKDQEQKDVSVVRGDFMKISSSVLEESSFQSKLISIEKAHHCDNYSQNEANNCSDYLPRAVVVEEAALLTIIP